MPRLTDIKIDAALLSQLKSAGVLTTEALLARAGGKNDRKSFCTDCGIEEDGLLAALNRADLSRIKGVSLKYSNLLEEAGVDTVPELAQRNAANLHKKLGEVNATSQLVARLPRAADVDSWVAQAKDLPRVIHYK